MLAEITKTFATIGGGGESDSDGEFTFSVAGGGGAKRVGVKDATAGYQPTTTTTASYQTVIMVLVVVDISRKDNHFAEDSVPA